MWNSRRVSLLILSIVAIAETIYTGCFTTPEIAAYNLHTADPIERHPYFVSMEYNNSSFCGATIISTKFVVTAASCIPPTGLQNLTLRGCTNTRNRSGRTYRIKEIIIHPDYTITKFGQPINDIALILIKGRFGWRKKCKPIPFDPNYDIGKGSVSVVVGMGEIENGSRSDLLAVELPLVDESDCNEVYKDFGGIADDQMCAGFFSSKGKGPCHGDEGGPLVYDDQLVGVYAKQFNKTCGDRYHPDVFTNVTHHHKWISKTIRVPD
ncbi:hypothetical protein QAD02_018477 [Eretmocerus hayati]|uniref:Uncharacterized protein n=1 Tax=Eretmocerus hayati TaxID=131215 RepID=A0ACC2PGY8_9HYME|nr:hypothetical protein QAD02_018477 [Eretmocerus hayati]